MGEVYDKRAARLERLALYWQKRSEKVERELAELKQQQAVLEREKELLGEFAMGLLNIVEGKVSRG